MNIEGDKIILRAMTLADQDMLLTILNDAETENFVIGWSFPTSKENQVEWYKNQVFNKKDTRMVIVIKDTNEAIGLTGLWDIDWKNRCAITGIKLGGKNTMGKGYGTESIKLVLKYAFEELNLNRIEAIILDYNKASQKLFIDKCGFKKEGLMREKIFKQGKYHDVLLISKLRNE